MKKTISDNEASFESGNEPGHIGTYRYPWGKTFAEDEQKLATIVKRHPGAYINWADTESGPVIKVYAA